MMKDEGNRLRFRAVNILDVFLVPIVIHGNTYMGEKTPGASSGAKRDHPPSSIHQSRATINCFFHYLVDFYGIDGFVAAKGFYEFPLPVVDA
jgi:hypothetical protein